VKCAEARDLAPELALGILGGAERAEVIVHVNGCSRCQAYVGELTEAADALPLLALEAEPSPGFEGRVLAAVQAPRRSTRRRWIGAIAAAAAAAAILSITIVRVVESGDDTASTAQATARGPAVAKMTGGASNHAAGWVSVYDGRGVTVAVDYGLASGKYGIQLQPERGHPVALGAMSIDDSGRGFWAGRSDVAITGAARIALVDMAGQEVCHGTLASHQ
jgi:hypothetical protein